jgi:hypothetical protein
MAGALAEAARFTGAVEAARTATRLAQKSGAEPLAREINEHLQYYEWHEPFRDPSIHP